MNTLFIGQNTIHLDTVDSTNSYATELLRQTRPVEGTVICTYDQQKGRGQRGNFWQSQPNKNVALSLILYPSFLTVNKQFLITKMVSLAVSDLMAECLNSEEKPALIKIKWPNDIYIENKKIAGILIENNLRESSIQSTVIGIGINVNQTEFDAAAGNPTSLKLLNSKEFELKNIIARLCEFIEARYLQLKANKTELIDADYLHHLYQLKVWGNYSTNDQNFEGKITGVAGEGKLQIELRSGEIKAFGMKEIAFGK